jgi:hypothetical protein
VVFNRSSLSQDEPPDESDLVVPGLHGDEQTDTSTSSSDDSIGYIICNQSLMSSLLENLALYDNVQLETEIKAKVVRKVVGPSSTNLGYSSVISYDDYFFSCCLKDSVSNSLVQIMLDNGRNVSTNLLVHKIFRYIMRLEPSKFSQAHAYGV